MDIRGGLHSIYDFVLDAGTWGIASVAAAALLFVIALWEHAHDKPVPAFWFVFLTVLPFWIGAYFAWRKQYVANRNGPDIHLDWIPPDRYGSRDEVRLSNTGKETATQVTLEKFSWPELSFPEPLVINAIHPNQAVVREPQFIEKAKSDPHRATVGHLSEILRSLTNHDREPLQVFVSFRDMNQTKFERAFVCEAGPGGEWGPLIKIRPGKLTVSRA